MAIPLHFRTAILLFVISLGVAAAVHLLNARALADSGSVLRHGLTVITADDAAYLVPVENFLAGKGWRTNAVGNAAYVQRSPGYSLFYLTFRIFLEAEAALRALFVFQLLLWSASVSLIPSIGRQLQMTPRLALVLGYLIGLSPMFFGFLSYTLTEAVVPSLVVTLVFGLLNARRPLYLLMSSLVLGLLVLIRVPMVLWLFALLPLLYRHFKAVSKFRSLGMLALTLLPLLAWQYRSSRIMGKWPSLHPIYHWDSNDLYRPPHEAIWGFHKMWGDHGASFHQSMLSLWEVARRCGDAEAVIDGIVAKIPVALQRNLGEQNIRDAYFTYYRVLQGQMPYHDQQLAMPLQPDLNEIAVVDQFQALRNTTIRVQPWQALIAVPTRVYYKDMAAHSNLSLYIFQATHRGKWWMEVLRFGSAALHLSLFVLFIPACFFLLIFRKEQPCKRLALIAAPVLLYLAYLAFVQRGIEERYTLPVLVPMLLVVAVSLHFFWQKQFRLSSGSGRKSPNSQV